MRQRLMVGAVGAVFAVQQSQKILKILIGRLGGPFGKMSTSASPGAFCLREAATFVPL